jgi:hypothetical protein
MKSLIGGPKKKLRGASKEKLRARDLGVLRTNLGKPTRPRQRRRAVVDMGNKWRYLAKPHVDD